MLLKLISLFTSLRAEARSEGLGLDVPLHGEEAYTTGEGAILVVQRDVLPEQRRRPLSSPLGKTRPLGGEA